VTVTTVSESPSIVRLDAAACLALLAEGSVGRVAVSIAALPTIRTVRYALAGDRVVFRVDPDSRLRAAVADVVIAFNADHCDDRKRCGWSVVVQGRCREVVDTECLASLQTLPLAPWTDTLGRPVYMSIPSARVSGEVVRW
jgi:nitroimidazol reductase NimA-like FMN-containing flavoprotein (pyridoxamine 5'-phosphate oxidase superfamily)